MDKVIVSPMGGCGTSFIAKNIKLSSLRPDVVFCEGFPKISNLFLDVRKYPDNMTEEKLRQWHIRSGIDLDRRASIGQNLVNVIYNNRNSKCKQRWVLLSGVCSSVVPFITQNYIKATCLVRHPLHAYVSFFSHQHPNHAKRYGGVNTEDAVKHYAELWNNITTDFIGSSSEILTYESFPSGSRSNILRTVFNNRWNTENRNYGEIDKRLEHMLYDLVVKNYTTIYGSRWKI